MNRNVCPVCGFKGGVQVHLIRASDKVHQKFVAKLEKRIVSLHKKGLTAREIRDLPDVPFRGSNPILRILKKYVNAQKIRQNKKNYLSKIKTKHEKIDINTVPHVACKICGAKKRQLFKHLKAEHNLTLKEYREMFPGAPNLAEDARKILSEQKLENNPMSNSKHRKKMRKAKRAGAKQQSETMKRLYAEGILTPNNSGYARGGYREDIGHYVRSAWEANVARLLIFCNIEYEYETKRFKLLGDDGKLYRVYIADFYLTEYGRHIEVKGIMDKRAIETLSRFQQQYPAERLIIITGSKYHRLSRKYSSLIENWEYTHSYDKVESAL